jgi:hypothetical protein
MNVFIDYYSVAIFSFAFSFGNWLWLVRINGENFQVLKEPGML